MAKLLNKFILPSVNILLLGTLVLLASFSFTSISSLIAADTTELSQVISDGTLDIAIVDANGDTVSSPSVSFSGATVAFTPATTTATLGAASEKLRVSNPTGTATWSLAMAATSGATASWSDGSDTMDFNDPAFAEDGADTDSLGGRLAVDPSGGTIAGVSGCSTSNVSLGSSSAFDEGVTDSITLFSASASASTYCRWDLTGVSMTQSIPSSQAGGTYTLDMTLTAS
jgi:hypothetical protein